MAWVHKSRPAIPKVNGLARMYRHTVVQPQPKRADALYQAPAYRAWARFVVARAGNRCEAIDDGFRCRKALPDHRMFADHVIELADGGSPFDPANGMCLCGSHHTIKTMRERAKRLGSSSK